MGGSNEDTLKVHDDGGVRFLELSRPAVLNALNAAMLGELSIQVQRLREDPNIRAVVISGSGERAFCAGADLDEIALATPDQVQSLLARGQSVFRSLERCGVPTIAAVDGYALGGGFELALSCTFVIGSERAQFGFPEAGLGLIPGYGGTQRLPRVIGLGRARRLMFMGERLKATEAYELGLLTSPPADAGEAVQVASELAHRISKRSSSAVRTILELTDAGGEAALAHETARAAFATTTLDAVEGIRAFREKREPVFAPPDVTLS